MIGDVHVLDLGHGRSRMTIGGGGKEGKVGWGTHNGGGVFGK